MENYKGFKGNQGVAIPAVRDEVPAWLNKIGLVGAGVEVGVQLGTYSAQILRAWEGRILFSVDPWTFDESGGYNDVANVAQTRQDEFASIAKRSLAPFGRRSMIIRTTSLRAATFFAPAALDFVYLDARHDSPWIDDDLAAWWPRIRPGGLLMGHDYLDGDLEAGRFRVKSAVDEFAARRHLPVAQTHEDWPTFFVFRPTISTRG